MEKGTERETLPEDKRDRVRDGLWQRERVLEFISMSSRPVLQSVCAQSVLRMRQRFSSSFSIGPPFEH